MSEKLKELLNPSKYRNGIKLGLKDTLSLANELHEVYTKGNFSELGDSIEPIFSLLHSKGMLIPALTEAIKKLPDSDKIIICRNVQNELRDPLTSMQSLPRLEFDNESVKTFFKNFIISQSPYANGSYDLGKGEQALARWLVVMLGSLSDKPLNYVVKQFDEPLKEKIKEFLK